MPKTSHVLAALKRDGWVEIRRKGSQRWLERGSEQHTWSYHDGTDLGTRQMRVIAQEFGSSLEELRALQARWVVGMNLRVEYLFDSESNNWSFRVPALRIVGGADTRAQADVMAVEAIEFTLESLQDRAPETDAEAEFLTLTVERR